MLGAEERELGGRVEAGVQAPVGGVGGEQLGEVDLPGAQAAEAGGEVGDVRPTRDDDGLDARAGQHRPHEGQDLVPGDEHAGAGVGELGGEVGRGQQRVGGGEGRPGQQDPVVDGRVLAAVRYVHGDDVTPADPGVGQPVRHRVRPGAELAEGQRDVVLDERRPVAPAAHRRPQDRADRDRRVVQRARQAGGQLVAAGVGGACGAVMRVLSSRGAPAWRRSQPVSRGHRG